MQKTNTSRCLILFLENFGLIQYFLQRIFNLCHAKKHTKRISILLLHLVRFSAWQTLLGKCQNHKEDGANFCGFLRKTELYEVVDARKRTRYFTLFKILVSKLTACEKGSLHIAHCYMSVIWGLSNVVLCLLDTSGTYQNIV